MPSAPSLTFFLSGQGGTLAFLKESDQAVFEHGIMHDALDQAAIDALNAGSYPLVSDAGVVNVENVRSGLLSIKTSVITATWKLQVIGFNASDPLNDDPPRVDKSLFLGGAEGTGPTLVQLSLLGITHLWVQPLEISTGTLSIAAGVFPYEQGQP